MEYLSGQTYNKVVFPIIQSIKWQFMTRAKADNELLLRKLLFRESGCN